MIVKLTNYQRMTFEEFIELAANPPRSDEETIFEVTEYDVAPLPERRRNHYPKFSVRESRIGFARTVAEGEALIKEAIVQAAECQTEIYCFHLKEFPVGEIISGYFGISCRLYDSKGVCIDRTYCSDLDRDHGTKFGQFRGRVADAQRFKAGDIVEVLAGDEVRLAVAVDPVVTPEWCWERREAIKTDERFRKTVNGRELTDAEMDERYMWDSSDDQITVIDGPDYSWHEHVSPLLVMPLHYPLSKRLRTRYEKYFQNIINKE